MVVAECLVTVDGQQREHADQLQALTQNVRERSVIRIVVIGKQCQYASCQRIHEILAGLLHDDIPHKIRRERTVAAQKLAEFRELLTIGKFAEQQHIGAFLKAEVTVLWHFFDDFLHVITAIEQLAVTGNLLIIDFFL